MTTGINLFVYSVFVIFTVNDTETGKAIFRLQDRILSKWFITSMISCYIHLMMWQCFGSN